MRLVQRQLAGVEGHRVTDGCEVMNAFDGVACKVMSKLGSS